MRRYVSVIILTVVLAVESFRISVLDKVFHIIAASLLFAPILYRLSMSERCRLIVGMADHPLVVAVEVIIFMGWERKVI